MWIKNFFNELKAWHIVRKEYRNNKRLFDAVGLKTDWGGRLYKVINRDPEIELGSGEDELYLRKELGEITNVMVQTKIIDILAYDLKPLEEETDLGDGKVEYEHGYLVTLTPAWSLDRQYVTFWSLLFVGLLFIALLIGLGYALFKWVIPFIANV